jgi:hypothetical protein
LDQPAVREQAITCLKKLAEDCDKSKRFSIKFRLSLNLCISLNKATLCQKSTLFSKSCGLLLDSNHISKSERKASRLAQKNIQTVGFIIK